MQILKAFFAGAIVSLGFATQALAQAQPVLPSFADLVEKHGPAVVNIRTEARATRTQIPGLSEDDPMFEFFRRFMPPDQRGAPRGREDRNGKSGPRAPLRPFGLGSGFVISADGYIVTNAHVIENAEEIYVRFTDKREMKAKVIGADKRSDVALVKVEAANLPVLKLGDSSTMRVGEWVVAIGSPFGFTSSVTAGILSAKSRDLPADSTASDAVPFLQTDVAVNPGNSGGPLFNLKGEVVGINSQIFSRTGSYAGISFAIPIDYATNVIDQLKKSGKVTRGRIGVAIQNVTRDLADSLGLSRTDGAAVGTVEEDSPAAKAGVEVGDVILKLDGRTVESSADLSRSVRAVRPGQKITVSVWRAGKVRDLVITVGEFKDEETARTASAQGKKEAAKPGRLGLAVTEVSAEQKKALKVQGGVAVEAVDGASLAAGVQPGDVILRVNNADIKDLKGYNDTLAKLDRKKPVALLIRDENGTRFVTLKAEE